MASKLGLILDVASVPPDGWHVIFRLLLPLLGHLPILF